VAGTATRAATPGGATRTPGTVAASGDFGRLLALVPQVAPLPGIAGVGFADLVQQKRNYGFGAVTSLEAARALGNITRLNNALAALPLPEESGLAHALDPQWRDTLGFDFWQVERTITTGDPPGIWTRLEGRFDRAAIGAALAQAGHQPVSYRDATILARGEDNQLVDIAQPLTRLTLARFNRVVLEDGALTATSTTALIQAGIDTRAGRQPSFAADPDYATLAAAMGAVVGARLLPGDLLFHQTAENPRATPARATAVATRAAQPDRPQLHPYRLVGLGLRDDGTTHTMIIALLYASAADARADAPLLRQRALDYRLVGNGQPLRERAVAGEPEVVVAGSGATVVLPLAIADEPNLGLWQQMLFRRDYGFLAE
jgi:hypothetical protein